MRDETSGHLQVSYSESRCPCKRICLYEPHPMPVLNFEYTSNIPIDHKVHDFLLETHHLLVREIKTDLPTCRSSICKITNFLIGDGHQDNAAISLTIRMLPGRSDEIKDRVGHLLLQNIKNYFADDISNLNMQIRVYLTETDKPHYYGLS